MLARLAEYPELGVIALFDEIRALGYGVGILIVKDFPLPDPAPRTGGALRGPLGSRAQAAGAELGRLEIRKRQVRLHPFVMVPGFSETL